VVLNLRQWLLGCWVLSLLQQLLWNHLLLLLVRQGEARQQQGCSPQLKAGTLQG
jgi:hypothetical protein